MTEQKLLMFIADWGYWAIAVGMFFEGLTLPFPGAAVVILAGTLAAKSNLNLFLIAAFAAGGYLAGNIIPYYAAKSGGRQFIYKYGRYVALSDKTLSTAESWFNKYGLWVVCFSRPFFFGNYVSYLAGLASMGINAFILFTLLGIFPWSIALSLIGFYSGKALLTLW